MSLSGVGPSTRFLPRTPQTNALKIYQLKQSMAFLKQEEKSVPMYFTQLNSLWDELGSIISISPCIYRNAEHVIG